MSDDIWNEIDWGQLTADEKEQILADFFENRIECMVWNEGTRRSVRLNPRSNS